MYTLKSKREASPTPKMYDTIHKKISARPSGGGGERGRAVREKEDDAPSGPRSCLPPVSSSFLPAGLRGDRVPRTLLFGARAHGVDGKRSTVLLDESQYLGFVPVSGWCRVGRSSTTIDCDHNLVMDFLLLCLLPDEKRWIYWMDEQTKETPVQEGRGKTANGVLGGREASWQWKRGGSRGRAAWKERGRLHGRGQKKPMVWCKHTTSSSSSGTRGANAQQCEQGERERKDNLNTLSNYERKRWLNGSKHAT